LDIWKIDWILNNFRTFRQIIFSEWLHWFVVFSKGRVYLWTILSLILQCALRMLRAQIFHRTLPTTRLFRLCTHSEIFLACLLEMVYNFRSLLKFWSTLYILELSFSKMPSISIFSTIFKLIFCRSEIKFSVFFLYIKWNALTWKEVSIFEFYVRVDICLYKASDSNNLRILSLIY